MERVLGVLGVLGEAGPDHHRLLRLVLRGAALAAVQAEVEVAVPPTERLPGSLPSHRVGLQGGDAQDLLPSVVQVVVVEVGQVGGLRVDLPSGAAVLRG